ncbi:hypothetical protein JST97_32075 [bacterium]|nr:hypothetical protein [bacterium]
MLKSRSLRRLLYQMESLWIRGPIAQMALLLTFLVLLAFLGGLVMVLVHPRYRDFSQASWWAFLHLTDTGYLGEDKDGLERVVAVSLTFIGAVVFVGGVIAILTTWFDRLMAKLSSGRGTVIEEGHLLLLGSNPGLADLIAECSSASAQRWPVGPLPTIVVVSETPLEYSRPASLGRRQRVVLRTGLPSDPATLERADYTRARVIIVLSSRARRGVGPSDLNVLKTLVALRSAMPTQAPRVLLDLSYAANARLIPALAGNLRIDILSSLEFSGRLLCQCLRYPGISRAYRQLLSDAVGQSILLLPCPASLEGRTLGLIREMADGGIILGVITHGQASLLGWERTVLPGDELVLLASSLSEVSFRDVLDPVVRFGTTGRAPSLPGLRVLAVGWSEGLLALLGELGRYRSESFCLTLAEPLTPDREQSLRAALGSNVELDPMPHQSQSRYDRVLLLSSDHQDPATADAETALRYANLLGKASRFVVELHEESNAPLFGDDNDIVITDQVVNHLLAQVSLKPAFRELYEELFTEGGCELRLLTLQEMGLGDSLALGAKTWSQLSQELFQQGFLALGAESPELRINPSPRMVLELDLQTRILVLVQAA